MDPTGKPDPERGLLSINVGTGGRGHGNFIKPPLSTSAVRDKTSSGVLKLTLHPQSFDWAFIPIEGAGFTDAGSAGCHGSEHEPAGDPEPPESPPVGAEVTFLPDADATVAKDNPSTNYGSKKDLKADRSPTEETYLRFSVAGVSSTVQHARLRLWVTNGSPNGPTLYPTGLGLGSDTAPWSESRITYKRRPARTGDALDDKDAVSSGRFVDYDVTALVTGDGGYAFALIGTASDGTGFASRQASTSSQRPRLILDLS
jgi:hypothetical protein